MDNSNEFDELARQKLAERSFAFEEGHWLAAQEALKAGRGNKRGAWYMAALVLLLLGVGTWWWARKGAPTEDQASRSAEIQRSVTDGNQDRPQVRTGTVETSPGVGKRARTEASQADVEVQGMPTPEPTWTSATTRTHERTIASSIPGTRATAEMPKETPASPAPNQETVPQVARKLPPALPTATELATDAATGRTTDTAEPNAEVQDVEASTPEMEQQDPPAAELARHMASGLVTENAGTSAVVVTYPGSSEDDGANAEGSSEDETPDVGDIAEEPMVSGDQLPSAPPLMQPNDTADATAPEAIQIPLVASNSPWEIGVVAGVFSSTSSFQGANSADWNTTVARQRGTSFGAEFMHMGRNFGLGSGVHYSTYGEGIAVDALNDSRTDILRFWFLQAVDTTILFITDTIDQGGTPYYVGEPVNTTVNVLTPGSDTTTTTEQLRAARELYNRVSYVEIPLLLDAHLMQGRWSVGLRAGPTLGVLSGRSGAVPNASNTGYLEFGDQAFRELTLGYTARAYIRYRWNAAWSVGLEPAIRGQLMNSFGAGPLNRRSSAFGGMLSLSYRLP